MSFSRAAIRLRPPEAPRARRASSPRLADADADAGAVLALLDSELVASQITDDRTLQVRDALAERVGAAVRGGVT